MPTTAKDLEQLTKLGKSGSPSERKLEVFPNHYQNLTVTAKCTEFTCFCPLTRQPDYAQIEIKYSPDEWVIESKSLKLYLESYRQEGVFHEHLAGDIAKDVMNAVHPYFVEVKVMFNVRGGIALEAEVVLERFDDDEYVSVGSAIGHGEGDFVVRKGYKAYQEYDEPVA